MKIVIMTLTYNRPENLKVLFGTLQKQTNKDFAWIIVDDGSPQDLFPFVSEMTKEADFHIDYYRKENGGKASATNFGLDHLDENDFVTIIDDDEQLYPDAIETIRFYAEKYVNTEVGIINFLRNDTLGNPIANPRFGHDYIMTIEERRRRNYFSDGYVAYYVKSIGNCRFPVINGEKYMGPSVLAMLVAENCSTLWSYKAIGSTEYLEDGITKSGRVLRLKSPRGMAIYSILLQSRQCGIKNKIKYAASYYAYIDYANIDEKEFHDGWNIPLYFPIITKLMGKIISNYWKLKYGDMLKQK